MATTKLMTAEELEQLEDDGYRYDLIDGKLIRMAPAGRRQGKVEVTFTVHLWNFVNQGNLGEVYGAETGFILARNPDVVLGPDVSFVRSERLPPDDLEGYLPLAPDLAVEVISPSDRRGQIERKVVKYLEAGVPLLVLVYPRRRTLVVHRPGQPPETLGERDTFNGGDVLPGFRLAVAQIFV
jgi:Uma2 family endonuclease